MLRVAFTLFGAFLSLLTCAQGTVRGKVTDKAGETLVGAAVVLRAISEREPPPTLMANSR